MKSSKKRLNTKFLISSAFVFSLGLSAQSNSAEQECEATVDMADSLDFHRMHMECNKDKKIASDRQASDRQETSVKETNNPEVKRQNNTSVTASKAPAILEVSEPFSLNGGPESAQLGLFKQMAEQCPKGWVKHQEIVKRAAQGFYLKYRFSCL